MTSGSSQKPEPTSQSRSSDVTAGRDHGYSGAPDKLAFIDALRGFAILGVIAVHTAYITHPPGPIATYAVNGQRGVQLFYVLSALTLFLSYQKRRRRESHPTRNFAIRRFFRIAPLFYLAIIAYSLKVGSIPHYWDPDGISTSDIVLTTLFLHGFSPSTINSVVPGGWSIAIEVGAYLLMPVAFAYVTSLRRASGTTIALYLLGLVVSWVTYRLLLPQYPKEQSYLVDAFIYFWLPAQLPLFVMGMALFFFVAPVTAGISRPTNSRSTLLLAAAVILLAVLPWLPEQYPLLPLSPVYGLAFCLLIYSLCLRPRRVFVNRVTCHIGRVSYSLYLSHLAVLGLVSRSFPTLRVVLPDVVVFPIAFLMGVCAATLFATLTYKFIELPGQSLGRAIIQRLEGRALKIADEGRLEPGL
jgi:peptidoglycan/LPS O-acetylase OafA/YrhL